MLGRDKSVIQQGIIATTDYDDWSGVEKEGLMPGCEMLQSYSLMMMMIWPG